MVDKNDDELIVVREMIALENWDNMSYEEQQEYVFNYCLSFHEEN